MTIVRICLAGFLLSAGFMACTKNESSHSISLDATKSNAIRKGEPIVFTFPAPSTGSINWSVTPSAGTQINTAGNKASVLFGKKGDYTVSAIAGNQTASKTVSVSDTVFTGTGVINNLPPKTLSFSSGESIAVTVLKIDSGAYSGLVFSALTTNSYNCLTSALLTDFSSDASGYKISYNGVSVPGDCANGTSKAGSFSYFYPVNEGTHGLTINFNDNLYAGSIVKSGNSYTITWNYSSAVTIYPKSL